MENEVAVVTRLRKNTSIPVPEVVRFDATSNNVLQHEFSLLERVRGTALHEFYDRLSQEQLHRRSWDAVSGLAFAPGRILEETYWQAPDVAKHSPV